MLRNAADVYIASESSVCECTCAMSPPKRPGSPAAAPPAKRPPPAAPLDIAAIRAQLAAKKAALQPPPGPAALPPQPPVHADVAHKLAAAKARIEALNARAANPYLSGAPAPAPAPAAPQPGVTSIALHPLLMGGDAQQPAAQADRNEKRAMRDRYKTMAPKFTSVRANASAAASQAPSRASPAVTAAPVLNPYASASAANSPAPDEERAPTRKSKKLQFSRAGKYVEQGEQLRNEQKMEALRQRIAEASRKAGLDSEFDTLERSLKVCLFRSQRAGLTRFRSDNLRRPSNGGTKPFFPRASRTKTTSSLPTTTCPPRPTLSSPTSFFILSLSPPPWTADNPSAVLCSPKKSKRRCGDSDARLSLKTSATVKRWVCCRPTRPRSGSLT